MRFLDLAQETHQSLSAKKGRSVLTILGIVIGIMAVVVMVSVITGFSSWLEESMGLGSARVVTVTSNDSRYELQYDDASFLTSASDKYESVIPVATTSYTVDGTSSDSSTSTTTTTSTSDTSSSSSSSSGVSLQVVGANSSYFDMENLDFSSGTSYTDTEEKQIVLDENAVENIYGDSSTNVVGQTLTLGNDSYKIVGVVESSSASSMGASSSMAYVSYETMSGTMLNAQQVDTLLCLAKEDEDVGEVADETVGMLAARHGVEYDDDGTQSVYSASTTESALESLENYTLTFDALAALVAGIALLVGGIGIMNMMLTNVSERIREIGLRKSLGARPRDITLQFLAESVALCLTGGVIGIIAGYAGAWGLVAILTRVDSSFSGLTPQISPELVLIVFAVCTAIGIVFGYYPARRAAKLNPAETMHYQ
jgi:ABC-type antimicrobial peptide transport system permease subunit